jgi:hypothetical protein
MEVANKGDRDVCTKLQEQKVTEDKGYGQGYRVLCVEKCMRGRERYGEGLRAGLRCWDVWRSYAGMAGRV